MPFIPKKDQAIKKKPFPPQNPLYLGVSLVKDFTNETDLDHR